MGKQFILSAIVFASSVIPSPAGADPVVLFFSRAAIAGAQVGGTFAEDIQRNADVLSASASASDGVNSAGASASFTSQLTANNQLFQGSGLATAVAERTTGSAVGYGSGQGLLEFVLNEPYEYAFSGSFAHATTGFSVWEASLLNRSTPGFNPVFDYREEGARARTAAGLLMPGRYQFSVLGRASAGCGFGGGSDCAFQEGLTSFSFNFRLSAEDDTPVVPEPATIVLLGSGLAGIIAARRRRSGSHGE